jgi:membrane associated rhomboid family serine protease
LSIYFYFAVEIGYMKTEFTRRKMGMLSNYNNNALIKLILASAIGFILAYSMYIIILVLAPNQQLLVNGVYQQVRFDNAISPYIALQPFQEFLHRPWIIFTYAWAHSGFWALLSNMLWMYCFGSVIQSLIGYKEILPLFIANYIIGGCIFLVVTALWPAIPGSRMVLGALPVVMGFAIASITLAPTFRFYLGDRLSIPLWVVLAIFLVLNIAGFSSGNITSLVVCSAAALVSFAYIKLLRSGRRPGLWFYKVGDTVQGWFTPKEFDPARFQKKRIEKFRSLHKEGHIVSKEESIDMLLDKINQKGYDSLTAEEKEMLMNASKEF